MKSPFLRRFGMPSPFFDNEAGFSPTVLLAGSTAMVWLDPSDLTTLFQDAAGTTPVTAPAQPVGLVLDKSQGAVGTNGASRRNRLTFTEQFDNAAWVKTRSSIAANAAVAPDGTTTADKLVEDTSATQNHFCATVGQNIGAGGVFTIYAKASERSRIGIRESTTTGAYAAFNLANGTVLDSGSGASNVTITDVGNGWYRLQLAYSTSSNVNFAVFVLTNGYTSGNPNLFTYTGDGTSGILIWGAQLELGSTATTYQRITADWPSTMAGNHATQSTAASRPTYGVVPSRGRVNLLTYTEFPNGVSDADIRGGLLTATTFSGVVGNAGVAFGHDGSTTTFAYKSGFAAVSTQYTLSVLVRMTDGNAPSFGAASATAPANDFALIIGGSVPAPSSFTVTNLGGGLFRVSATTTTLSTLPANHTGVLKYNTNSGRTFTTSGWQLELGTTASPYQRVVSQFEVTDPVGFPSYPCHYLSFDGVDDFLVTPTITPNADKVQVFAGVRKLSDALVGIVAETSVGIGGNNGSLQLAAPFSGANYTFQSRGTTQQAASYTDVSIAAPVTNVVTGVGDISSDIAALRVNGVQVAQNTVDQGTGNYLAYPLYIGRRGGTALPFNGQLYNLIVRFSTANLDASVISQTERWMGGKIGVTIA